MDKPRAARPTIRFIDEYCASYKNLFPEVRSFEAFKHLHVGMISSIKRKTLPEIAKVTGLDYEQSLHHFLTKSPWSASELRKQRLSLILQQLKGRKIFLIIDETGDKKKRKRTDYVNRQYLGKLGKIVTSATPRLAMQLSHKYGEASALRVVEDLKLNHNRAVAKQYGSVKL